MKTKKTEAIRPSPEQVAAFQRAIAEMPDYQIVTIKRPPKSQDPATQYEWARTLLKFIPAADSDHDVLCEAKLFDYTGPQPNPIEFHLSRMDICLSRPHPRRTTPQESYRVCMAFLTHPPGPLFSERRLIAGQDGIGKNVTLYISSYADGSQRRTTFEYVPWDGINRPESYGQVQERERKQRLESLERGGSDLIFNYGPPAPGSPLDRATAEYQARTKARAGSDTP